MADLALRPLSVGEILDRSFGIFRRRFGSLALIALICLAIPAIVLAFNFSVFGPLLAASTTGVAPDPTLILGAFGTIFLVGLLFFVLVTLANAAIVIVVSETHLGREVTALQAIQRVLPSAVMVVLLALLQQVIMVAVGLVTLVPMTMFTRGGDMAAGFVGLVIYMGLQVFLFAALFVSVPALVLEKLSNPFTPLGRSWSLTTGRRLPILAVLLLLFVLMLVVYAAAAFLGGLSAALAGGGASAALVAGGVAVLIVVVAGLGGIGLFYTVQTVTYYDLRVRKEAFDLEVLSASLGTA